MQYEAQSIFGGAIFHSGDLSLYSDLTIFVEAIRACTSTSSTTLRGLKCWKLNLCRKTLHWLGSGQRKNKRKCFVFFVVEFYKNIKQNNCIYMLYVSNHLPQNFRETISLHTVNTPSTYTFITLHTDVCSFGTYGSYKCAWPGILYAICITPY